MNLNSRSNLKLENCLRSLQIDAWQIDMARASRRYQIKPPGTRTRDKSYLDTWAKREKRLGEITYAQYLKSDEWKEIKAKARTRPFYSQCFICGSKGQLDIHHRSYRFIHSKNPMRDLIALCRNCHECIHWCSRVKRISVRLATNSVVNYYQNCGYLPTDPLYL